MPRNWRLAVTEEKTMTKIPIALQLYSVREDCQKDLPAVLQAVARMGYQGVEFAGYYNYSAQQLRTLLDDLGLKCAGTHTGLPTLLGDALPATVEFNRILGNEFLIVPGLPRERTESKAAWLETARLMNEISERVKPEGMRTGYHNHHTEFHELEGELPWDIFFGNTSPDVVMQFDTGNAMHGGAEAGPFLRRYPHRALTVHLKEFSSTDDKALIGEGEVKWGEIFELCETIGGTQWYIVEQESYAYPPLECVDKCLQKLRAMGK
jgi:sugar phosphate isomerase/epimerase